MAAVECVLLPCRGDGIPTEGRNRKGCRDAAIDVRADGRIHMEMDGTALDHAGEYRRDAVILFNSEEAGLALACLDIKGATLKRPGSFSRSSNLRLQMPRPGGAACPCQTMESLPNGSSASGEAGPIAGEPG